MITFVIGSLIMIAGAAYGGFYYGCHCMAQRAANAINGGKRDA